MTAQFDVIGTSTMSSQLMHIRFIRRNENNSKNDDTVRFVSIDGSKFDLTFTSGDTKKSTTVSLSDGQVFRWTRNMVNLLANDADPFEYVQMDMPLMPSILLKVSELDDNYNTVLNAVEFNLDNWPLYAPSSTKVEEPSRLNTGFYEAEDDEEEEEEYDYSDMPALVPITPPQRVRTHHTFLD